MSEKFLLYDVTKADLTAGAKPAAGSPTHAAPCPPRFAGPRHRAVPAAARAHPKGPAAPAILPIDDHAPYMGSLVIYGRPGPVGAPADPPHQLSPSVAVGTPPSDQRQLPPGPYPWRRAAIPSSCLTQEVMETLQREYGRRFPKRRSKR
jgi:hypothetical protein